MFLLTMYMGNSTETLILKTRRNPAITINSILFLIRWFLLLLLISPINVKSLSYVYGEPKYKCPVKTKLIHPCHCVKGSDVGIYVTCDNANLATLSVGLQNLASFHLPIEELIIQKGHFARLYGPLFAKVTARFMTIIHTPLVGIDDYVFFGLNNTLERLELIDTELSEVTPLSFGILSKLTHLIIDGHNFTTFNKNLFVDQGINNKLENIRIINGPLEDVPIELFQPLRKLKTLDLHGNRLRNLRKNQFKNLRELEILDISHNEIEKLEAQHISDLTKLGWCNASHNALTELARGTFARNAVLKVLNLSHNKIKRLDSNSFRGMRFLRRLYLSDNLIKEVGRGTFGSVARIGTIDLARNALTKVEYQMFTQLNYVEILDLAENNISIIEKNSFKDIYQASINISHNILETIESKAFENCVNITILDLSYNHLKNFSKNCFDETTFATVFQLAHNQLSSLIQIPLQNMTGLRVLNASFNNIIQIPKNSFPKLYELHTIDLSHNNITSIFNGVFQTLFSIRYLDLSYNHLEEIKSSMFGTLPTLLELNLTHNSLHNIIRGSLAKLTSLRWLDLSYNNLEKLFQIPISLNDLYLNNNNLKIIPVETWPVMNALILMDLSYNHLENNLDAESFSGLLVLQKLFLRENGISKPPASSLSTLTTLQYLYLENNNITVLEKHAFGKLPVLFELNLCNNGIKEISKRAFEGLLQLLHLNLSSNALDYIPNDAFLGLPSLRKLDLSYNLLTKLDNKTHGVLEDLLSLEYLNLSHNKISFVTKKTFPENPYIQYSLRYLDLSYNLMPVLTYDITFGTKKLHHLNLSHNYISELRRGVLGNLTSLQYLDLSNNQLTNLNTEEHLFDIPENLTHIYLQNNRLHRLPFNKFLKDIKMHLIDLRNNSLSDYPLTLLWNLKNGTNILYEGNPLHCNCGIRPLKHYTLELSDYSNDLEHLWCSTPKFNENMRLLDVQDENLLCSESEKEVYVETIYEKLPDVRFRDVVNKNGKISLRWMVVNPNSDIAEFTIYIRDMLNNILYQEDVTYNVRKLIIPNARFRGKLMEANKICIIVKDSLGVTGQWFAKQCQPLPKMKEQRTFVLFSRPNSNDSSGTARPIISFGFIVFSFYSSICFIIIVMKT